MPDKPPETVGFTIAAAVSIDRVGYVLKALFDNGCPPSSFDLKALFDLEPFNGETHTALPTGSLYRAALPPPGGRPLGDRAKFIRELILAFCLQSHPQSMRRANFLKHVMAEIPGVGISQIDQAILRYVKDGILLRVGMGETMLSKEGLKLARAGAREVVPTPPHPSGEPVEPVREVPQTSTPRLRGHQAFAYSLFAAEPLKTWTKFQIKHAFEAAGRNSSSAKDVIDKLYKAGLLKRPSKGHYLLAPTA